MIYLLATGCRADAVGEGFLNKKGEEEKELFGGPKKGINVHAFCKEGEGL